MRHSNFVSRGKCPACESGDFKIIYRREFLEPPVREYLNAFYSPQGSIEFDYLHDAHYSLAECMDCTLVFQEQIPDDQLMVRLYEKWIGPENDFMNHRKDYDLFRYTYYAQEIMQLIAYLDEIPSKLAVLDFGMGWGAWALMAKAFGCNAYGVELSERRIDYARSIGLKVLNGDEISDYAFDFINTEQVFEHLPEPQRTLSSLSDALKSHGLLKISVPNGGDIKRRLNAMDWEAPKGSRNSLNPVAPLEHINCFNRKAIHLMAQKAGLEPFYFPLPIQYQFATGWRQPIRIVKNLLRPLYRNVLRRGTYIIFRKRNC